MSSRLSRRRFLEQSGGAGAAVLLVGFSFTREAGAQEKQERKLVSPFDAWVQIGRDGSVRLLLAKSEMGQGVMTSLPMILAEELDVDWSQVRVEQAPTDARLYQHGTGGSTSIRTSYLPLRQAGAAAREMLVAAAAAHWQVGADTCQTEHGSVVHGPRLKRLSYGELVEAAAKQPVPDFGKVTLKNPTEFKILGREIPRTDVPSKTDGSARFGIDVRVPGMLHAVIARCPSIGGKPAHFDATAARAVPGVRHVIQIPAVVDGGFTTGGIAVVADSTWAAIAGREALKVEWDPGPNLAESSQALHAQFEALLAKPGEVCRDDGNLEKALAAAAKRVEAVYELPFQAHAPMEPLNCTVDVRPDRAEAWIPCQGPQWPQDMIAKLCGLPKEQVKVNTTLMGGGFGRRYHADFAVEATQVSKAVGAPVQVLWTREDDIQHDFYRPAAMHRFQGGLDDKGQIVAWHDRMSSVSIDAFWTPPDRAKPASSEIGGASNLPYQIPNLRMEYALAKSAVPVMWWRSVEHSLNGFATEAFLDELAAAAGVDPLALRLRLLAEPRQIQHPKKAESILDTLRLKRVLELAAEKAGWAKPLLKGQGRGIAAHFSFDTYVAEVAEVTVGQGQVKVNRMVCAVDCGRVINPDGVRAQMEGGIAYGLTAALKSGISITEGRCKQSNFHDYDMLRIDEMPVVEVHIVPSTEKPTGTGEPGLPPVAAAVANAIFAATGKRIRHLPIRPADLA